MDLRKRTVAMLPRVDPPRSSGGDELGAGIPAAFTAVPGGRARLEDLDTSIAACLAADVTTSGTLVAEKGVPALESSRLSHVFQNDFRPETIGPAEHADGRRRQAGSPGEARAVAWWPPWTARGSWCRSALFARPTGKLWSPTRYDLAQRSQRSRMAGCQVVSGTARTRCTWST